jgi:4-hydroxybenzoate polyprenyltransferase
MNAFLLPTLLRTLRPAQWLKNGIVPAAFFFAWRDPGQNVEGWLPVAQVALAVFCFCCVSSAVYQLNDLRDIEADRAHPVKRLRPLAAGALTVRAAVALAAALLLLAAAAALLLPPQFAWVAGAYVLMQVLYTFALKRVAYLDVFVIALGFVLRAVAGAAAVTVRISPWLLLCTFLLALFLALCKRRHEKLLLEEGTRHREALSGYDRHLLDIQIGIAAAATVVCYAIYTLAPETVGRFGTDRLALTVPFVLFGIFRYLSLVYQHDEGGRPEKVMLTDKTLIITVLCYVLAVATIFWSVGS